MREKGFARVFIILVVLIITGIVGVGLYLNKSETIQAISSFEECIKAGFPVMESYPRQCRTSSGKSFTEPLSDSEKAKLLPPKAEVTPESSPSADTTDWKTYTNKDFMFKYPSNWNVLSQCSQEEPCVVSPDINEKFMVGGEGGGKMVINQGGRLNIVRTKMTDAMRLKDVCQPGGPIDVRSCKEITVAGYSAMKRIDGDPEDAMVAFVIKDQYFYAINMLYTATGTSFKHTLDQILSTFKFK